MNRPPSRMELSWRNNNNLETQDASASGSYSDTAVSRLSLLASRAFGPGFPARKGCAFCLHSRSRWAGRGHAVSALRLIVGDEESTICKLTALRDVAETWGGTTMHTEGVCRGDVVYFESAHMVSSPRALQRRHRRSPPLTPPHITSF